MSRIEGSDPLEISPNRPIVSSNFGIPSAHQSGSTEAGKAPIRLMRCWAPPGSPDVLVGHSLGGFIATVYARTFPADVSGIVLIDAASQYLQTTLGPAVFAQWAKALLAIPPDPDGEAPDMTAGAEAINALAPVPPMPASVLSAQAWPFTFGEPPRDHWPQWFEAQ
jgi:pimeloyl-ACP methyl ester carboxylesterase